jgi:hypothetical protein
MTARRDLKSIIRDRQRKTGEAYTAARSHVMRERAQLLGIPDAPASIAPASIAPASIAPAAIAPAAIAPASIAPASIAPASIAPASIAPASIAPPRRVEAAVLKVGDTSARIRVLGEDNQITLRSRDVWKIAPGHIITARIEKRWTFGDHAYASGRIEDARIDVARLGLVPLPLDGGDLEDLRKHYEPYRNPDPYAPLWRKLTAKPRRWYEMDAIAWGAFPDDGPDESPTSDAAELNARGDTKAAREILMNVALRDLRCLDAHAHLGNLLFDRWVEGAIVHYEIGVRIGELSLPTPFDGVLMWSALYNRPFLRCLHGYALCLWRLGRTDEAVSVFERILALNPNDNQGARFCWLDVRAGRTWEAAQQRDEAEQAEAARKARIRRSQLDGTSEDPRMN